MLSLIIPVFNKVDLTKRCLNSVLENSRALSEVFVIDNASGDDTPTVLMAFQEKFRARNIRFEILTNAKNLGFGSACNQGVRLAQENFIAILNNDTWLMRGWDEALQQEIARLKVDVIGPFVDERPITENPQAVADEFLRKSGARSRRHFVPILMFFKRETVDALRLPHGGIFDERFFVTYEDTDLMYRLKKLGLRWAQTSRCYLGITQWEPARTRSFCRKDTSKKGCTFLSKSGASTHENPNTLGSDAGNAGIGRRVRLRVCFNL